MARILRLRLTWRTFGDRGGRWVGWGYVQNFMVLVHVSLKITFTREESRESISVDIPTAGFLRVMENLESHGILEFHFPCLESHEI